MSDVQVMRNDGATRPLYGGAIDAFRQSLRGKLLDQADPNYESTREIWNAMITRRPALIARCAGAADVIASVRFARDHNLLVSVRGGGHNVAGNALCDGGLTIDLSPMRSAKVDPKTHRAWIEPGCLLADMDHETQAFGLATPLGINSTTGIAGLTLGGGFGWLSRKHGLTTDNLVSATVVTAAGELIQADATENSDLFWAIRGGGGNFGIVTNFEFQLHPVGPTILSGLVVFPLDQAASVLRKYKEFGKTAPRELSAWVVLRKAPPLPFLPESIHGKEVAVVIIFYCGDPAEGRNVIKPIFEFGTPAGHHVDLAPYAGWQKGLDPLMGPGARNYWKTHNFATLGDGLIDVLIEHTKRSTLPECDLVLIHLGEAVNDKAADATAYAQREATYVMNIHGRWMDAKDDEQGIGWTRGLFEAAKPFAMDGGYINFMTQDDQARVKAAFGKNYDRLVAIKKKYDPGNMFRLNQNIAP